jgi:hypothetical protein
MDKDAEHLRLLSIFHYVLGGLSACFSSAFIIHMVIGLFMINSPASFSNHGQPPPPAFAGWLFFLMGSFAVVFGWTFAGLLAYAGYCLSRRKHLLFCIVVAAISCLFMPFGTVLGVFTIIVLQRPGVRAMFNQQSIST